jgi:hypothetical protein
MSREPTSRNCATCRYHWPEDVRTPIGNRYFVPVCTLVRNEQGPAAQSQVRAWDGLCGPDGRLWKMPDAPRSKG